MKHISEIERPWAKWSDNSWLTRNPILGYVTPEQEQDAINAGAIVKEFGEWKIPAVEIIAEKDGGCYKAGDKIKIVSFKYRDWIARQKSKQGGEMYEQEANDSLGKDIPDFPVDNTN